MLTDEQKAVAEKLREERPAVLPGTNVIISDKLRERWYTAVTKSMHSHGVQAEDVHTFCDIAGVPD